jgi:hypothetical protein
MENLFEEDGRTKWKETILSSSFMDVDPHNGTMEIGMYKSGYWVDCT